MERGIEIWRWQADVDQFVLAAFMFWVLVHFAIYLRREVWPIAAWYGRWVLRRLRRAGVTKITSTQVPPDVSPVL